MAVPDKQWNYLTSDYFVLTYLGSYYLVFHTYLSYHTLPYLGLIKYTIILPEVVLPFAIFSCHTILLYSIRNNAPYQNLHLHYLTLLNDRKYLTLPYHSILTIRTLTFLHIQNVVFDKLIWDAFHIVSVKVPALGA